MAEIIEVHTRTDDEQVAADLCAVLADRDLPAMGPVEPATYRRERYGPAIHARRLARAGAG